MEAGDRDGRGQQGDGVGVQRYAFTGNIYHSLQLDDLI
jgi:hypothetical protein